MADYTTKQKQTKIYFTAGLLILTLLFQINQALFTLQREFVFIFKRHVDIRVYSTIKDQNGKQIEIFLIDQNSKVDFIFIHGSILSGKVFKETLENMAKKTPYNIISYYMRGMNNKRGQPTEKGLIEEAYIVGDFVKQRGKEIVVYGQSLGCSVALSLATRLDANKTILENPFINYTKQIKKKSFLGWFWYLAVDKWNNVDKMKNYKGDALLLVSENDTIVDREDSELLKNVHSKTTIKLLKGSTHFNVQKNTEYHNILCEFIK